MHNGVNRSLIDLFRSHLVLLLPTIFLARLSLIHFTPIGWTTKEGNADERNLFDAKDSRGASPLNPGDKEAYTDDIRAEWGCITHADLAIICKMILAFEAETASWYSGKLVFAQRRHSIQSGSFKSVSSTFI